MTTTATTIASNATTVIAALVAMCLLDWRLALFSLAFVPPSVWMTRRVGRMRRLDDVDRQVEVLEDAVEQRQRGLQVGAGRQQALDREQQPGL